MKELDFLSIIKKNLNNNSLLGDDCAYLKDLDIFTTQDTLVEDVHFSLNTTSPYLLGRKAVNVNLSDLAAAMAKPEYIVISISLPKTIKDVFVDEFYKGVNDVCIENQIITAGGDITSSSKVVISVCAIGKKIFKSITSRSFAKQGDYVLVSGNFGSSSAGLYALSQYLFCDEKLKEAHLNPKARIKEAFHLGKIAEENFAMMDSSDGLADALYKIALQSKRSIEIDMNKVPYNKELLEFSDFNNLDYKKFILWGGEDFELVCCVNEKTYEKIDKTLFTCIGRVLNKTTKPCVIVNDENKQIEINQSVFENNSYNHFSVSN